MKNLLFTLIALFSGIVSAQSFNFEKFPPIRVASTSGATLTFVAQYDLTNQSMAVYRADKDGFMYLLVYDIENDTIRGPLVAGNTVILPPPPPPVSTGIEKMKTVTKTLSELTIEPALIDEFLTVLEEAQKFEDINGGFEKLFDGHLRVATNGDSEMVTIFDTLDSTLISVPKDVVVYRYFYLFKS